MCLDFCPSHCFLSYSSSFSGFSLLLFAFIPSLAQSHADCVVVFFFPVVLWPLPASAANRITYWGIGINIAFTVGMFFSLLSVLCVSFSIWSGQGVCLNVLGKEKTHGEELGQHEEERVTKQTRNLPPTLLLFSARSEGRLVLFLFFLYCLLRAVFCFSSISIFSVVSLFCSKLVWVLLHTLVVAAHSFSDLIPLSLFLLLLPFLLLVVLLFLCFSLLSFASQGWCGCVVEQCCFGC